MILGEISKNFGQHESRVLRLRELKAHTTSTQARTSSENVTSRFCNYFSIIQSHYPWKMRSNHPGIKTGTSAWDIRSKIEHLSSYAHVVHATAKRITLQNRSFHVVERTRASSKCQTMKKCTCKACKTIVFHCQLCKFVRFLLPLSSWFLKLHITSSETSFWGLHCNSWPSKETARNN